MCALGRACVPVHVPLHARGVCHGGRAPLSCTRVCTHGRWACGVCAPCVRVHAPSMLSCSVLALPTCTTRTLCTLTAGSTRALCQHCGFTLTRALSTLGCSLCAHSFTHTVHAQCVLCASTAHTLSAHALCALTTCCTRVPCKSCVHAHSMCSMHALHTPHILCARSRQSQLHPPRAFSPWAPHVLLHALCILSLHAACTLAAHPRACPMHPSCTLRVPSCTLRACFPCAVLECPLCTLHAHPLAHSLRALIACSLCTHVCFLHAPCTLIPARKPLKRCPRKMRDGRGKLWVRSIGN